MVIPPGGESMVHLQQLEATVFFFCLCVLRWSSSRHFFFQFLILPRSATILFGWFSQEYINGFHKNFCLSNEIYITGWGTGTRPFLGRSRKSINNLKKGNMVFPM
jgi:hypothetical protein